MLCADLIYELYLQSARKDIPKSLFSRAYFRHRWLNIHQNVYCRDPSTLKRITHYDETRIPETTYVLKENNKIIFTRCEYNFRNITLVCEYDDKITMIAYVFREGKLQSVRVQSNKDEIKIIDTTYYPDGTEKNHLI